MIGELSVMKCNELGLADEYDGTETGMVAKGRTGDTGGG
jgi:hypothetical protein